MTYVITEICIGVKGEACMEVCPEFAIFSEPVDMMSFIDPALCADCGACSEACVVGAIFPRNALPHGAEEFVAINEQWFRRKHGVRERVREIAGTLGFY
jgi:Fe-S-cluster-containing hydrogenase component 2